jgi:uncharacterized protein (TIGR03084 family)
MANVSELLADLDDEYADLRARVEPLSAHAPEWDLPTPAEGWAVRDQISHLAFFDEAGRQAMVDPEGFAVAAERAMAASGDPMEEHLARGRSMDGDELLAWWDHAHQGMMQVFTDADPTARLPWYGPSMGILSFLSARLMETWAHGQDVADALGPRRVATDRLRHVAHLGVRTRPFSYLVRGLDLPAGRIDVVLTAPSGELWEWAVGEDDAGQPASRVEGQALDFCLVVTQRRNWSDAGLLVEGDGAAEWLSLAQAFAGPPGPGRPRRAE